LCRFWPGASSLAVALYPVFNLLSRLLGGRPRLAATILTAINLGIVIGPATWLGLSAPWKV
jgi:predicted PurR-regulated permease PerM